MKLRLLFFMLFAIMGFGYAQITSVALVGAAVGGWPGEPSNPGPIDVHQLTQVDAENWIIENLTMVVGPCKLRANNIWGGSGFEWAGEFPTAIGTSSGDIQVPFSGIYNVSLNTTTGVFMFTSTGTTLPIVQLIGSSISNGTAINLTPSGTDIFTATEVTLVDGLAQFRINQNDVISIFGETTFPTGVLTGASNNIPVIAADYASISLNIATGEYSFVLATLPPNITISGTAIEGPNNDVEMATNDGVNYYYTNLSTTQGELLFNNTTVSESYGNSNFPSGIATLNGNPVQIPFGNWNVTFNASTKNYEFLATTAITSVAIVGSAVGGWPGEPNNPGPIDVHQLTQVDAENWMIENLIMAVGPCKIRANNIWGGAGFEWAGVFPTAVGTNSGDIYIPIAGTYRVTLNTTTGVYNFETDAVLPNVQLIGSAISIGNPVILAPSGIDTFSANNVTLLDGTGQFYIDGNILGENQFPTGTLTGANNNIPIIAATYSSISVNIATGEYSFVFAPIPVNSYITLSGSAIGAANTDVEMTTNDGVTFFYPNLSTTQGELLFNINTTVTESYGNANFPSGIATLNGSPVLIPSGTWNVTFNIVTKTYLFSGTAGNPSISIVGSGAGGWPGSPENPGPIDIHQMVTEDGITYTIYALAITEGEVKFREDNSWTLNWGNAAFPSGIGTQGGNNIIVTTAGTYTVTFNRMTGEYDFETPNTVAIVGTALGGWPTGAVGEIDAHQLESTDGIHFRLDDIELTDGEVKFRQNNSWDVFWGGTSLTGDLILNGPSIPTTSGTYTIVLNKVTGNYSLGTRGLTLSHFKIHPNPTTNVWNFTSAKQAIETIQIVDVSGKTVMRISPKDLNATVDASSLKSGMYFAKISTANATETAKLVKN